MRLAFHSLRSIERLRLPGILGTPVSLLWCCRRQTGNRTRRHVKPSPQSLFRIGWDYRGRLRFRRGYGAPSLQPNAVAGPQPCAPDRSNEFAAHRLFRLYLNQRFVADLGRRTLSECGRRKADSNENEQCPHRQFTLCPHGPPTIRGPAIEKNPAGIRALRKSAGSLKLIVDGMSSPACYKLALGE